MSTSRDETTFILSELARGVDGAADRLMPRVYDEIRRLAENAFRHQNPAQTLQPTALAHEAYIQLIDVPQADFESRAHFMAVAATIMRRTLVDGVRRRCAQKRGGDRERVAMGESVAITTGLDVDLLDLDEALSELSALDERKARIVELRFFGGLELTEVATALGIARSTVTEDWRMARAWLATRLEG